MLLSEESSSSVSWVTNRKSSITSSDLPPTSSWREDSKPSCLKSNWPTQSITPEWESDKDIWQLVDNWSTSHLSWFQSNLNHTLLSPQHQSSSLVNQVESKERREAKRVVMTNEHDEMHDQMHCHYVVPFHLWEVTLPGGNMQQNSTGGDNYSRQILVLKISRRSVKY